MSTRRRTYGLLDLFGDMELLGSYYFDEPTGNTSNYKYYTDSITSMGIIDGDILLVIDEGWHRSKSDTTYRHSAIIIPTRVSNSTLLGFNEDIVSSGDIFYKNSSKKFGFWASASAWFMFTREILIYRLGNISEMKELNRLT